MTNMNVFNVAKDVLYTKGKAYELYKAREIDVQIEIKSQKMKIELFINSLDFHIEETYPENKHISLIDDTHKFYIHQKEKPYQSKSYTVKDVFESIFENAGFLGEDSFGDGSPISELRVVSERKENKLSLNLINVYRGNESNPYFKGYLVFGDITSN